VNHESHGGESDKEYEEGARPVRYVLELKARILNEIFFHGPYSQ
jgi:hypothetical protein